MSLGKALRSKSITRIEGAQKITTEDLVAVEEPLEIRAGGRSVAVVMRTPGHDRELAAGFLVTEGIVRRRDDVLDIVRCSTARANDARAGTTSENIVDVLLAPSASINLDRLTRHVFTSSSCGICSKASIEAVHTQFPKVEAARLPMLSRSVLEKMPEKLRETQPAFAASGALHACALFAEDGALELVREDVGRHNALDKVIGHAFFGEKLPLAKRVILVSGRVSFEIMQKALAAGVPCVAAISAPTSAAIEFAEASGQMLIGFLRGHRMNVYAGTLTE